MVPGDAVASTPWHRDLLFDSGCVCVVIRKDRLLRSVNEDPEEFPGRTLWLPVLWKKKTQMVLLSIEVYRREWAIDCGAVLGWSGPSSGTGVSGGTDRVSGRPVFVEVRAGDPQGAGSNSDKKVEGLLWAGEEGLSSSSWFVLS